MSCIFVTSSYDYMLRKIAECCLESGFNVATRFTNDPSVVDGPFIKYKSTTELDQMSGVGSSIICRPYMGYEYDYSVATEYSINSGSRIIQTLPQHYCVYIMPPDDINMVYLMTQTDIASIQPTRLKRIPSADMYWFESTHKRINTSSPESNQLQDAYVSKLRHVMKCAGTLARCACRKSKNTTKVVPTMCNNITTAVEILRAYYNVI